MPTPSFTKNSTLATVPSASAAVAAKATGTPATTCAPVAGAVIATVGATFAATVIVTVAEVALAPRLSVARAASTCVPTGTLLHV